VVNNRTIKKNSKVDMKFEDRKVKHNVVTQGLVEHCIGTNERYSNILQVHHHTGGVTALGYRQIYCYTCEKFGKSLCIC